MFESLEGVAGEVLLETTFDARLGHGGCLSAEELFKRLLSIMSHPGLLAEEYDPIARRQTGIFPQGFSHLDLIYTAGIIENMGIRR